MPGWLLGRGCRPRNGGRLHQPLKMQWDALSHDTRKLCLTSLISHMWITHDEESAVIAGTGDIHSFNRIRLTNRECRDFVFSHIFETWHIDTFYTTNLQLSFTRRRFCVQIKTSKSPQSSSACGRTTTSLRQLAVLYPQRTLLELLEKPVFIQQDVPTVRLDGTHAASILFTVFANSLGKDKEDNPMCHS